MATRRETNLASVCTLKEQFLARFLECNTSVFQEFPMAGGAAYAYLDQDGARLAKITLAQSSPDLIDPEFNGIQVDIWERGMLLHSATLLFEEMHPLRMFEGEPKGAGAMAIWAAIELDAGVPVISLACVDESKEGLPRLPIADLSTWNDPVFRVLDFWQNACH